LWTTSQASSNPKDFHALKNASIALNQQFIDWKDSRVAEFKPTTIGNISPRHQESEIAVGYWPGKVDTYFDFYTAGVWNIFRAARLLLLLLIIKLSDENDTCSEYIHAANRIVEDMAASIPYHLTDNLQVFISQLGKKEEIIDPGKYLGGMLLMHPLYVASEMPFVHDGMRECLKRCLAWIGEHMGFGQATVLANVRNLVLV
jgi:hypothetical protein